MTFLDDHPERRPPELDALTAERMLLGLVSPDEAPPGYAGVARLVIAAQRPPAPEEVAGVDAAVLAALMVLRDRQRDRSPQLARVERVRRSVKLKVASVVFVGTMAGTTGLAAAGVLPEPLQHAAARVLSTVGITVPDPANHGREVSETARTTDATGRDKGKAVSEVARQNGAEHGRSDEEHGKSEEEHGKSDEEHGKPDGEPGASDEDHGESDEDHGKSDDAGNDGSNGGKPEGAGTPPEDRGGGPPDRPDDGADGTSPPSTDDPSGTTGSGNGNGNGGEGNNGNGGDGNNGNGGNPNDLAG